MERHLPTLVAAALLQRGLVAVGYTSPESQVDAVLSVLRVHFARATIEDDRLVAEVLRVFGRPETVIWVLLQAWCEEFGRDAGEVWQNVWAPGLELEED